MDQPRAYSHTGPPLSSGDDFARNVWCLLGIPVDGVTLEAAAARVRMAITARQRLAFVTPNVNWLVLALRDRAMRRMVIDADFSVADGAPLVMMAKMLGLAIPERVAGSDLFEAMAPPTGTGTGIVPGKGETNAPIGVFFFGGQGEAARKAHDHLNQASDAATAPAMQAAGWLNPGFGDLETMSTPSIIAGINRANPDFLIVALGAAKGQQWIDHNLSQLNAPVIAHLGAVVDFTAGTVVRAPRWMARAGLEWLWRIIADKALWRRYAKDGLVLAVIGVRALLPQLLARVLARLRRGEVLPARAVLRESADDTTIMLAGSLRIAGAENLTAVRDAFRTAAGLGRAVTLDFTDVGAIDHGFLGLCLMLEKHLTRARVDISLANISHQQLKMFRRNAMEYRVGALRAGPA